MGPAPLTIEQSAARLWARVDKTPGHGPNGDCWPWTGPVSGHSCTSTGGYGWAPRNPHTCFTHRLAYTLTNGPIPRGMVVMHTCDIRACCNPAHLILGTYAANAADMAAKGRASNGRRWANGEERRRATLTAADVVQIRKRRAAGERIADIADAFDVGYQAIRSILIGRTWRHVPMPDPAVAP